MSGGKGQTNEDGARLSWRDYVALFFAALQTVALPLLVFIIIVLAAIVIARFVR